MPLGLVLLAQLAQQALVLQVRQELRGPELQEPRVQPELVLLVPPELMGRQAQQALALLEPLVLVVLLGLESQALPGPLGLESQGPLAPQASV